MRATRPRLRPVPYLPRSIGLAAMTVALAVVVVVAVPEGFLFVGLDNPAPRSVSPAEYAGMLTALLLALALRSRYQDWDRYGIASRTRNLALLNTLLTVAGALLVTAIGFALPDIYTGLPEVRSAIASNVTVAALSAVLAIGLLGAGAGSLTWMTAIYGVMYTQSHQPDTLSALPLSIALHPDGTADLTVRWAWITGLTIATTALTWRTHMVPLISLQRTASD